MRNLDAVIMQARFFTDTNYRAEGYDTWVFAVTHENHCGDVD